MTDKLLIDRELLERANSLLCSYSSTLTDRAVTRRAISEICGILAAPRQPEGEGLTRYSLYCSYDGGGPADEEESPDGDYVLHSDAQRAIAELREECERVKADRASCWAEFKVMTHSCLEAEKERDTLRQQRDKLAGLLREFVERDGYTSYTSDEEKEADSLVMEARAALAEVEKAR